MKQKLKFKQTEIGMIPEDWEVKIIGDLVKINENTINKNYSALNIEYIDTSSVDKGHLVETQKLKLEEAPSRAKRIIKDHDILISTVRPNLKHFFFVKKSKQNLVGSTGFAVISTKKINPEFLYYYLTTENYTNFLTAIADAHTSTYPSFNPDVIETSFCPFPEENEQFAIAKILFNLDSKIELNQQMNKTLEAIGQAIFKRWFIDFEFPNEKGKPYKSSGGKMVDSEIGEIPKGWRIYHLIELVKQLKPGTNYQPERFKKGIPFVNVRNIQNGFLDLKDVKYISEVEYKRVHEVWMPEEHDLVITRIGTLGNVGVIRKQDLPLAVHYNSIDIKQKDLPYYFLYFLLKSNLLQEQYHLMKKQSVQEYITIEDVEQIKVVLSKNLFDIKSMQDIFQSIFNQIEQNFNQTQVLSQIRDSLLPRLMSGKIRVPVGVDE